MPDPRTESASAEKPAEQGFPAPRPRGGAHTVADVDRRAMVEAEAATRRRDAEAVRGIDASLPPVPSRRRAQRG